MKKIAIVHDWLTNMGGAEQVVINFHELYHEAPIYTTFYSPNNLCDKLKGLDVRTSFLQRKKEIIDHKKYFPLMPLAFSRMNVKDYDVILSSSSSCAKGIRKRKDAIHVCYIHTPMRYAYEYKSEYLKGMNPIKKILVNILLFFMRMWDKHNTKKVDYFIANSTEIQKRVKKTYNRDSVVINPPVRVNEFTIGDIDGDYYFVVSRLVGYKRFDLAVKACTELNKKLVVIGDGPEKEKLEKMAGPTVQFLGRQPDEVVKKYMSECKALLFPGLEDFGIVPVEAQACGRPVICYGKGGVLDTVIDGETGVYFKEQTVESLKKAIKKFEKMKFDKKKIREHSLLFSEENFKNNIKNYIDLVTKPKVAVDARMINMSGIGTYIRNLMKSDCYQIALGNKEEIKELNKIDDNSIIDFNTKIYGIKEQLKFPYKKLRKLKPSVLHVPHYNVPLFYRGKMITTIHDLTHLVLPEFLPNKFAKFYAKFMMKVAIKKSEKIITVSENTKKDIIKYFKVNPNKIEVIYNGVSNDFCIKDKKEINYLYKKFNIPKDKKLLLYVGNLKPHKNLNRLLEAFSKIKNIDDYRLILVGKTFDHQINLVKEEKDLLIDKYVIHTGIVSSKEIIDLYNLVDLFIFPSLYEGFGLPVIESLACGTNVICSNNSSLPEVGGKLVDYFDPYDVNDIKNKIEKNINKTLDYKKVSNWINQFDWITCSNEFKKIINEIEGEK